MTKRIHGQSRFDAPFTRIGVVGLGLIGGSIALRARAAWPASTVVGFDRPEQLADAIARSAVHEGADSLAALSQSCDCLVLAAPLRATIELLPALAGAATRTVVTDVGSTKRQVMEAARALPAFVGGHPMAGSERSGLEHARAELFEGRPWLLVRGAAPQDACDRVETFVNGLGASPRWIAADEHDRAVAYLSHLPQVVAVALMNAARNTLGDETIAAVSGRAFAEMTRLADSPPEMWQSVLGFNADYVDEALREFAACLPDSPTLAGGEWVRDAFVRAARDARARQTKRGR